VEAFERLQRAKNYLYQEAYSIEGLDWRAIEVLQRKENSLRHDIAMRIEARIIE